MEPWKSNFVSLPLPEYEKTRMVLSVEQLARSRSVGLQVTVQARSE